MTEESRQALTGSRPADSLLVWVWRGTELVLPEPLEVVDWSEQDSAGDSVKVGGQVSLTVADPGGVLGAWRFDDPLGVGGTRLQVIYRVGGAGALNFGWYRLTDNEPFEVTQTYVIDEYGYVEPDGDLPPHKRRVHVTKAYVRLDAADLTLNVDLDRFEAPESPGYGASVISEFQRLTEDHFPVTVDAGVDDAAVSRLLVYDRERLEACQDLLSRVGARYRMGGDGECHVYPRNGPLTWRVEPAVSLVSVRRKQSLTGLYNRWVVEGKEAANGKPVRGVVSLDTGPLRYGGPHGRIPAFYNSEMITTQRQAYDYAITLRDEFLGSLAVELAVQCVPRPELQAGDRIEVGCPVDGNVAYLPGVITSISRSGNPVPGPMSLTVQCSYADVVAALARTEWARHLTDERPSLTWDMMPGTWGTAPTVTWDSIT